MQMGTSILCGIALLGTASVAAFQGLGPAATPRPPEVEAGKLVSVDWKGTGPMSGEVLQVNGSWVKLRFMIEQKGPDANSAIAASSEAWVNFDRLTYYNAPRDKKK